MSDQHSDQTVEELLLTHIYHGLKTVSHSQHQTIDYLKETNELINDMVKAIESIANGNSKNAG